MLRLRILWYYLLTKYGRRFRDRRALLDFQEKKLKAHLKWVRKHSPFLKTFSGILDKKIMMDHFSSLNTLGIDREEAFAIAFKAEATRDFAPTLKGATVGLSSGTSGNRGLFLVSERERARHAGTMLAKILPDSILSRHRVAFFMRANSNLYTASQSARIQFEFFDLLKPIEEHFQRLDTMKPSFLFAPPSMLILLAKARKKGLIRIHPKRIFSIAETLDPLDQRHIEAAFDQRVHQIYQCTEGFLGVTCEEGTIHLNEDCVRIEAEWLDQEKKKFIPIITDFTRTSQPIIRYRLNDILTERSTPCPCGSVMMALESIEGRSDDLLDFLNENGELISVFPDFIRRAILTSSDQIEEYLVRQETPGTLQIHLITQNQDWNQVKSSVERELKRLAELLQTLPPALEFHAFIPPLRGRKLRRVERVRA